jgi:hypothetical protein
MLVFRETDVKGERKNGRALNWGFLRGGEKRGAAALVTL